MQIRNSRIQKVSLGSESEGKSEGECKQPVIGMYDSDFWLEALAESNQEMPVRSRQESG